MNIEEYDNLCNELIALNKRKREIENILERIEAEGTQRLESEL